MFSMDKVIANNILKVLMEKEIKQTELAKGINVSPQVMSRMLSGTRTINGTELNEIASFCGVNMDDLVVISKDNDGTVISRAYNEGIKTKNAKKGLQLADEIIKLHIFCDETLDAIQMASERSKII